MSATPPAPTPPALKRLLAWCVSPEGRKDIGAALAAIVTVYTAIHRAGV